MLHADALLERTGVLTRIEPEHRHTTFVPFPETFDALHRRRLASTVGSDQAEDLPSVDIERDVRHGDGGAVPLLEVPDSNNGIGHVCFTGACREIFTLCSKCTRGVW